MNKRNTVKAVGLAAVLAVVTAGTASAAVVTTTSSVRSGPGFNYHSIGQLYPGQHVSIVDRAGRWCGVTHTGPEGWVRCNVLSAGGLDRGPEPGRYGRYHGYDHYPQDGFYSDYPDGYDGRYGDPGVTFSFGVGGDSGDSHYQHPHP